MLRTYFSLRDRRISVFEPRGHVRGNRIKRRLKWSNDGVASTVGTIMALMVFLAFLSMFTSQYVPVWMEENEASHMNQVYSQFASLKQAVDMQILAGVYLGTSPVQMFSPVKLGANGIPMFAAPTPGYLTISRQDSYDNVSFSFNTTGSIVDYTTETGGTISMYAPNRYYVTQELAYENDALIIRQPDGEYTKANPQFTVTKSGARYLISYTQVDIRGDDSSYIGFGTRGVQTVLKAASTTTFTNLTASTLPYLYINHTTWYESAWNATFNQTLMKAGMTHGVDYMIVSTLKTDTDMFYDFYEVSVRIDPSAVSRFSLTVANIEVVSTEMGAS